MIALWLALALGAPVRATPEAEAALEGPIARAQLAALHEALIDRPARLDTIDSATGDLARRALVHPDPRVRRIAVQAVRPWTAPTLADPPSPGPTPFLDEETIATLARDPDPGVRRQTLQIVRSPHPSLSRSALAAILLALLDDRHAGVRAAALRALPDAIRRTLISPEQAFELALARTTEPVPSGRAACDQLARLAPAVREHGVPIERGFALCLHHHPERAWAIATAWRDVLPVREDQLRRLLYETTGLSPAALRRWIAVDRALVERLLADWPTGVPTERRDLARRLIFDQR